LRADFGDQLQVTQAAGPMNRTFSVERRESGEVNRFEDSYVLYVDAFYPRIFDISWLAGNPQTALDHPNSVVLTEDIAAKCFGHEAQKNYSAILGKSIVLNN
jgi:hypothetical protein